MVLHLVMDAAHQAHLVHHPGHARQMLAHLHARHVARDRLEQPANAVGRVGLHVERFQLAGAAELVKKDHDLGAEPAAA